MAHVTVPVRIPDWLWKQFVRIARRRRRKPEALIEKMAYEYVQQIADEELLAASERAAQRANFREEDTEEIIRELRRRKAKEMADGGAKGARASGSRYQRVGS